MEWTFSIGWFVLGLLIIAGGGATVVYYKQIADSAFKGVNSYNKVKLGGLIAIGIGFLCMTNLHTFIFGKILQFIMPDIFH
jgi:hypothetical protein